MFSSSTVMLQQGSLNVSTLIVSSYSLNKILQAICLSYRKLPTSTGVMSSAPAVYLGESSSYLDSTISTTENYMPSSNRLNASDATKSSTSAVLQSTSVPSLSEPIVTTVDTSTTLPHVAGKPLKIVGNENKSSGGNPADRMKINIKTQSLINKSLFLTTTASTTGIVPINKVNASKYSTAPTVSMSQKAYSNTSTKPTSSINKTENSTLPASTGRPSHKRSSSFHKSMLFSS